jgi:hypothetical protein
MSDLGKHFDIGLKEEFIAANARKLLLFFTLLLAACASSEPRSAEQWMARERNACLPAAVSMAEGLKRQGVQAKVVRYGYNRNGKRIGHAITAYLYPPGDNQLWTYDYEGSWRTRAFWEDAMGIAATAERLRARHYEIKYAEFLP